MAGLIRVGSRVRRSSSRKSQTGEHPLLPGNKKDSTGFHKNQVGVYNSIYML